MEPSAAAMPSVPGRQHVTSLLTRQHVISEPLRVHGVVIKNKETRCSLLTGILRLETKSEPTIATKIV